MINSVTHRIISTSQFVCRLHLNPLHTCSYLSFYRKFFGPVLIFLFFAVGSVLLVQHAAQVQSSGHLAHSTSKLLVMAGAGAAHHYPEAVKSESLHPTLLIHRQQQVNLLHRWTCNDLKVFSTVFLLKQSVQSLEYLLDVIPDRLEKDELCVSIGQVQGHAL